MKYFYLTAAGTTAGPESLATLSAMIGSGEVHLGTLVVPAGGEDWTPLARVLRFFHAGDDGTTSGPVVFSELYRLHQVAALPADAWVMEEAGTEWKSLSSVLTAAGVEIVAAPAPAAAAIPRTATGAYRPPPVGGTRTHKAGPHAPTSPYAAPHAPIGKTVIRHRATGGIGRLAYFVLSFLLGLLVIIALMAFIMNRMSLRDATPELVQSILREFMMVTLICQGILLAGTTVLALLRNQNIGWPWPLVFLSILPSVANVVAMFVTIPGSWFPLVVGLLSFASLFYYFALLILPPGYARHRRLDTAAKVITGIIFVCLITGVTLAFLQPWKDKAAPATRTP